MGAPQFTDTDFTENVLNSPIPVLVDFWAVWCGPCIRLGQTVDEIAAEYEGRVRVGKVNLDANPEVATQYGVQSLPTTLIFKEGKVVDRLIGAVRKNNIVDALSNHLMAS